MVFPFAGDSTMTSDLATTSLSPGGRSAAGFYLRAGPATRLTPRPPGLVTVAIRDGSIVVTGRNRPRSVVVSRPSRPRPAANVAPWISWTRST